MSDQTSMLPDAGDVALAAANPAPLPQLPIVPQPVGAAPDLSAITEKIDALEKSLSDLRRTIFG